MNRTGRDMSDAGVRAAHTSVRNRRRMSAIVALAAVVAIALPSSVEAQRLSVFSHNSCSARAINFGQLVVTERLNTNCTSVAVRACWGRRPGECLAWTNWTTGTVQVSQSNPGGYGTYFSQSQHRVRHLDGTYKTLTLFN